MLILDINKVYTAENYPYGGQRTKAFFGVEFRKKKGFRTTFQTIKPGTEHLNAVKNSTYSHFIALKQEDNGHYDWLSFQIRSDECMIKVFTFIIQNYTQLNLSLEMHQYLMATALQMRAISTSFITFDSDIEKAEYKEKYNIPFSSIVKGMLGCPSPELYTDLVKILEAVVEFDRQKNLGKV